MCGWRGSVVTIFVRDTPRDAILFRPEKAWTEVDATVRQWPPLFVRSRDTVRISVGSDATNRCRAYRSVECRMPVGRYRLQNHIGKTKGSGADVNQLYCQLFAVLCWLSRTIVLGVCGFVIAFAAQTVYQVARQSHLVPASVGNRAFIGAIVAMVVMASEAFVITSLPWWRDLGRRIYWAVGSTIFALVCTFYLAAWMGVTKEGKRPVVSGFESRDWLLIAMWLSFLFGSVFVRRMLWRMRKCSDGNAT